MSVLFDSVVPILARPFSHTPPLANKQNTKHKTESYYQIQPAQAQAPEDYRRLATMAGWAADLSLAAADAPDPPSPDSSSDDDDGGEEAAASRAAGGEAGAGAGGAPRTADLLAAARSKYGALVLAAPGEVEEDAFAFAAAATATPAPSAALDAAAAAARVPRRLAEPRPVGDEAAGAAFFVAQERRFGAAGGAAAAAASGARGGTAGGKENGGKSGGGGPGGGGDAFTTFTVAALGGTSALEDLGAGSASAGARRYYGPLPTLSASLVARGLEQAEDGRGAGGGGDAAGYLRQPAAPHDGPAALLDSGELDIFYGAAYGGGGGGGGGNGNGNGGEDENGGDENSDPKLSLARLWAAGKAVLPGEAYRDGLPRAAIYYAVTRPSLGEGPLSAGVGGGGLSVGGEAAEEEDGQKATKRAPPPPLARGMIAQGGRTPLSIAFPGVALSNNGTALFSFTYSDQTELPDGSPAFAGAALAVVAGPRALVPYQQAGAVAVARRGAGLVVSPPVPGLVGPRGEVVLRLGGGSAAQALGAAPAAVAAGGGAPQRFATATSYAATRAAGGGEGGGQAGGAPALTTVGVWLGAVDVSE